MIVKKEDDEPVFRCLMHTVVIGPTQDTQNSNDTLLCTTLTISLFSMIAAPLHRISVCLCLLPLICARTAEEARTYTTMDIEGPQFTPATVPIRSQMFDESTYHGKTDKVSTNKI